MITDPDYARIFTKARCIAWQQGYALVHHGTTTRDLDLLAVPWSEPACNPKHLVNRIVDSCQNVIDYHVIEPAAQPHGRLTWTLVFKEFGDPRWIDLSVFNPIKETD